MRESDYKNRLSRLCMNVQAAAMGFDNIIGNTQSKPRSLRPLLRRKKRLQDFVFDGVGNPRPVVLNFDYYLSVT